jgi:hypothetical protein
MPRFEFSLSSRTESNRLAGAVTSASFSEALEAIVQQTDVEEGDTLEIGVKGFPPARFEYATTAGDGIVAWRPSGYRLAA